MSIDLARLYFGLKVPHGTEWFREPFAKPDLSFSLIDNEREVAVLASGLLSAAISDGKLFAALAALCMAAAGHRTPVVWPELLKEADHAVTLKAIENRQRTRANPEQIKLPSKVKIDAAADAIAQTPDWAKASELFKQISNDAHEAIKNLASQTAFVARPLAADVQDLREEVSMLWWHIGGWSRLLEKPFADLEPGLAAVMAGIDLADLSFTPSGPAAAPAILQRTITAGRNANATKLTIKDAVDAFPGDAFEGLALGGAMVTVPDACPILAAFAKAGQIGSGSAWHGPYTKATGLEPTTEFQPLDLALQVYRERLLLTALSE
jgi:hypothetical protein